MKNAILPLFHTTHKIKSRNILLCAQPCPTLCDLVDCNPPGSSAHAIFQARILGWVPFPTPRDLLDPGIKPISLVSPALADKFFTTSTTLVFSVVMDECESWTIKKAEH